MDKQVHEEFQRVHQKLDRIDSKLDDYAMQLVETKQDVHWISGHLKFATAVGVAVISGIILYILGIGN